MEQYSEEEKNIQQTEYNLNLSKSMLISSEISRATFYYNQRSYANCYQTYKSIRLLINNRLTKGESLKCKNYERTLLKKGTFVNNLGKIKENKLFGYYLEKYIELVNELLKKIGLDIRDESEKEMF